MFFADLIMALIMTLLVVSILAFELKRSGTFSLGVLFLFFLMLLLGIWAGGVWLTPIGPSIFGVYWISFMSAAIFFTILIMSMLTRDRMGSKQARTSGDAMKKQTMILSLDFFFITLLLFFAAVIIVHYMT